MTTDGEPEPLSESHLAAISAVVRREVKLALAEYTHKCNIDLTPDIKQDIQGAIHDARQLGEGSFSKGLAEMNENHRWIRGIRVKSEKASWAFSAAIISLIAIGSAAALVTGIISRIKQ